MPEPKICAFWDRAEEIQRRYVVCRTHYDAYSAGELDACPECGDLKDVEYEQCLSCYRVGRSRTTSAVTDEPAKEPEPPPKGGLPGTLRWSDEDTKVFYVYMLAVDGEPGFYAGTTNDLQSRKLEHVQGRTKSTAGRNPKLVWFSTMPSREEASTFEHDLWSVIHSDNPRPISRLIVQFRNVMGEVDDSR